jgi:hypothetical protein
MARGPLNVTRSPAAFIVLLSALLFALRLYAATRVGFGDSEALYACYAMHPQPAYLDHPGLIGIVARAIGGGGVPSPIAAHVVTSLVATLVPLLALATARAAGAAPPRAALAAIALASAPEITVGLFGLTPDLLLAVGWLGALALAADGLRAEPGTARAAAALLGAGLLAGAACTAKLTGLTLVVALGLTYASARARAHARTVWPWAGLAIGLIAAAPIALYEAQRGWPMLAHRLVDTQGGAGPSLRNVGALVGGQLTYVSPLLVVAAALAGRLAWRARAADAVGALLFFAFVLPLAALVPLAVWSPVAEPHWLAPPLLALPIAWARSEAPAPVSPRFGIAACATGLTMSLAVHAWVLVPSLTALLPRSFDPRWDLASELYGWTDVARAVTSAEIPSGAGDAVVVGPHWVVCAQLHAALGPRVPIGCATPIRDDFDDWLPRATWERAGAIVFVTDTRFEIDTARMFPGRATVDERRVTILRGGRPARIFTVRVLDTASRADRGNALDRPRESRND